MALANLSINVSANTGAAVSGLRDVGNSAQQAFAQSGSAVDAFRTNLARSTDAIGSAARSMGGSMQAANDAIVAGASKSETAIQRLVQRVKEIDFKAIGASATAAFSTAQDATQGWLQKTGDAVDSTLKGIGVGLVLGIVSSTAAAVYSAYRIISGSLNFITGLFSGESYKSASIDQLIALNDQVKALQENLNISAQEASALLDAMNRLGVDKADYSAVYKSAETAMRTNGDELDRLGVKYKAANGALLDQMKFLQNVKAALDEYSVGSERNAAAAAMGAGSYEQIVQALKVTEDELQASKARLDEFGVSMGPNTQTAVEAYQQAMRDFNNETQLTSQGFSRAIADNIMPLLTDLAVFFKEGFPSAVQVFRVAISTVTGLFYAFKDGVYIVAESVLGSLQSIGIGIGGLAAAAAAALTGNFAGAKDALLGGLEGAWERFKQIGTNIVAQVMHNDAAIKLATGNDDRTMSLTEARATVDKSGKKFVPKPAAPDVPKDTPAVTSAYQNYLLELDRTLAKVQENEYASMRLKAAQLAQKEGITDLSGAYDRINAIQRTESQKAVDEMIRKLGEETAAYAFETSQLGKTALESDKLSFANQHRLQMENDIAAAKKSGKPLDDQAVAMLRSQTEATIRLGEAQRDQRDALTRSGSFGTHAALQAYQDDAANAAKFAQDAVTGSLSRMEDALIEFSHTGKLNFASLWQYMADEFLRQQIRMAASQLMSGAASGLGSLFGSFFSGNVGLATSAANALPGNSLDNLISLTGGFGTKMASGTNYVPYDGMPATLHKGEAVLPAKYNPDNPDATGLSQGGSSPVNNYFNVGAGVARGEVVTMMQAYGERLKGEILTSMRNKGAFARAAA